VLRTPAEERLRWRWRVAEWLAGTTLVLATVATEAYVLLIGRG
jgi:hypothetical protein